MDNGTPQRAPLEAERLARVVDALLADDVELAQAELAPIAGLTGSPPREERLPTSPRVGWPPRGEVRTRNPHRRVLAQVFARDSYTCTYCGRKTVHSGILRLLSLRFPNDFPLQANWKLAETHRAYWDVCTSVDHIHAVSRGGDWQAVDNLTTACYRCQHQKSNFLLTELGWEPRRPPRSKWEGLTSRYVRLWTLMGSPPGDLQQWARCFESVSS